MRRDRSQYTETDTCVSPSSRLPRGRTERLNPYTGVRTSPSLRRDRNDGRTLNGCVCWRYRLSRYRPQCLLLRCCYSARNAPSCNIAQDTQLNGAMPLGYGGGYDLPSLTTPLNRDRNRGVSAIDTRSRDSPQRTEFDACVGMLADGWEIMGPLEGVDASNRRRNGNRSDGPEDMHRSGTVTLRHTAL